MPARANCIYEGGRTLYIQPDECINCGLCETVCPVAAIHADDRLPEELKPWIDVNRDFLGLTSPAGAGRAAPTRSTPRRAIIRGWWTGRESRRRNNAVVFNRDSRARRPLIDSAARADAKPGNCRDSKMSAYREFQVELHDGVTLSCAEHGDPSGQPVLLLHGYSDSWRSYRLMMPELPPTVRAIAITTRGHGNRRSRRATTAPPSSRPTSSA